VSSKIDISCPRPAGKAGRSSRHGNPRRDSDEHPFARIATVAFASLVLAAGAASAQEMRRDQVQDRLHDTNQRINEDYREGEISRGQAHELKQENRAVGRELRRDERDGYLSRGEQADINRQINRQTR
jgi:septal ring factor EnvC (AmiA/AmiB activator)